MGTEVLRPRDISIERFRIPSSVFHRRRSQFSKGNGYFMPKSSSNNNANRKPTVRTERPEKKKVSNQPEQSIIRKSSCALDLRPTHNGEKSNSGLVMGQVSILRRGESFDSINSIMGKNTRSMSCKEKIVGCDDLAVYETRKLGLVQPEMVSKQIRVGLSTAEVYAGLAFSNSPSPRSLPLPSFFSRKHDDFKSFDDSATRDLRRLLRLEC